MWAQELEEQKSEDRLSMWTSAGAGLFHQQKVRASDELFVSDRTAKSMGLFQPGLP